MEGAPKIEEQPSGPFASRKRFNRLVQIVQALVNWQDSDSSVKIVYGDNKVMSKMGASISGGTIEVSGNLNGSPATARVVGKLL